MLTYRILFYLIHYIESKKRRLAHPGRRVAIAESEPTQVLRTSKLRSNGDEQLRSAVTRSCISFYFLLLELVDNSSLLFLTCCVRLSLIRGARSMNSTLSGV